MNKSEQEYIIACAEKDLALRKFEILREKVISEEKIFNINHQISKLVMERETVTLLHNIKEKELEELKRCDVAYLNWKQNLLEQGFE